ncbi:MAG: hypothetical protein HYZ36_00470, partial [Pedosphaera parvula]|nr:hypothetical protein [Pedosphaera parvula]
ASGTAPTYKWKFNGGTIDGATNATLVLANVGEAEAGKYKVEVENAADKVTSAEVVLTVVIPPVITQQLGSLGAMFGDDVKLTLGTSGTPPTYFWQFNGTLIATTTTGELRLNPVQLANAGRYLVIASNAAGMVISSEATLTVNQKAAILSEPAPFVTGEGDAAVFAAIATGTPAPTYMWKYNGALIPGATNAQFILPNDHKAHAGKYRVRVVNPFGSAESAEVALTVLARPAIITQPLDINLVLPNTNRTASNPEALFTVAATGDQLSFQWFRDGSPILPSQNSTADESTLELKDVIWSDAGEYYVVVSNAVGVATSAVARLSAVSIVAQPQPVTAP